MAALGACPCACPGDGLSVPHRCHGREVPVAAPQARLWARGTCACFPLLGVRGLSSAEPCGGWAASAQHPVLPRLGGAAPGAPWPGAVPGPVPQPLADADRRLLLQVPACSEGDGQGACPPRARRLAADWRGQSVPLCLASSSQPPPAREAVVRHVCPGPQGPWGMGVFQGEPVCRGGRVSTWAMGQGSPRNGVWAACEPSPPWAALTGEPESGTPTLPGRPAPGSPGSCRRLVPPERGSSGDNAAHKTRSLGCTLQESTPEATHSFPSARWEDPTTRGKAGDRLGPDAVRRPQPRPRRLPLSHAPQGASEDSGPYPPQSRSEFQFPSLRHTDAAAGTRGR